MDIYKYYYTYLIVLTNPNSGLFGKVYFGQHRTNNLEDNYIGSGKILYNYIKKHPNDYYKEIIRFYNNQEELNKAEYELIHPHLNKEYCINLVEGGRFGKLADSIYKEIGKKVHKQMIEQWQDQEYREIMSLIQKKLWENQEYKNQISNKLKQKFINYPHLLKFYQEINTGEKNPMYGKNCEDFMTPEAIEIKRNKQSKQMKGRKLMTNGIESKKVKPENFEEYLNKGYSFVRP